MMAFEDIQIQLVDTPPLNRDYVEAELLDLIKRSDVVLLVVDLQADPLRQVEETTVFLLERRIAPLHMEDRFAERRLIFVPMLVLANKNDDEGSDEDFEIFVELLDDDWPALAISVTTGRHLERLKRRIFEELDIIRVYSKAPGQEPDLSIPFVLERGSTVEDMAGKVHKDFADKFKSARIWGSGAFEGQVVSRDHVLHDGDVVELHVQ
jgi:ribosome-interacting GTPase 1